MNNIYSFLILSIVIFSCKKEPLDTNNCKTYAVSFIDEQINIETSTGSQNIYFSEKKTLIEPSDKYPLGASFASLETLSDSMSQRAIYNMAIIKQLN